MAKLAKKDGKGNRYIILRLSNFLIHLISISSILFILSIILLGLFKDNTISSIDTASLLQVLVIIFFVFVSYNLEGIQQAANSISEIDKNVIKQVTKSQNVTNSILGVTLEYDKFSAARQVLSILSILALKEVLSELSTPPSSGYSNRFVIFVSYLQQNSVLQLLFSAIFISTYLQLLPKKIAKMDPIRFLGRSRRSMAYIVTYIGKAGLEQPVKTATEVMGSILDSIPKRKQEYPLSNKRVLDELGKRNGFYVKNLTLRFCVGTQQITATETALYVISKKKVSLRTHISGITHRLTLGGSWTFFEPRSNIDGTPITSHRITRLERREVENTFFHNANDIDEPDQFEPDDHDLDESIKEEENDRVSYDGTAKIFTQVSVFAKFTQPVDRAENPNANITIETDMLYLDHDPSQGSEYQTRKFQFAVQVPIENLSVIITTTGKEPPKDAKLLIRDVFDWPEETVDRYSQLDQSDLVGDEIYGVKIDHALPYVGNRLTLQVDI